MPHTEIDWAAVRRILVVRLRSIGDTVLATPSLIALRRFLPNVQIDILLENWVAPLLDGFRDVDNVLTTGSETLDRVKTIREIRRPDYDVVFNLHGGTTATMFTAASGARHRIGFAGYQYSFLHNHAYPPAIEFWGRNTAHSAEQQLALLGYAGVPVEDRPKGWLAVTEAAKESMDSKLPARMGEFALMHPAAAFASKQWPAENFSRTAEFLDSEYDLATVAVASKEETEVLERLKVASNAPIVTFDDLSLPEITALASRAKVFIGNDSGIAHIAAAVDTPVVVIFGPSNRDHWYPWTDAPNRVVFNQRSGQPCPVGICSPHEQATCIHAIDPDEVFTAANELLRPSDPATP